MKYGLEKYAQRQKLWRWRNHLIDSTTFRNIIDVYAVIYDTIINTIGLFKDEVRYHNYHLTCSYNDIQG